MRLSDRHPKKRKSGILPALTAIADEVKSALAARRWGTAAALSAVLMGVSVALSPTGLAIAAPLILVFWLLDGQWRGLPAQLRDNFSHVAALMLMAVVLLGAMDIPQETELTWRFVRKYRELLLIPILFAILVDERFRRWVLAAVIAGIGIMMAAALVHATGLLGDRASEPAFVFHQHITFSALVAFFAFWAMHAAAESDGRRRWLFTILAVLAFITIFVLSRSRTGYVLFVVLAALFLWQRPNLRRTAIVGAAIVVGLVAAYATIPAFERRLAITWRALATHESGDYGTSIDQRLELYRLSLDLIAEKPVFGHGTGSYPQLYRDSKPETPFHFDQPHNEYLLIAVEQGSVGLGLLLLIFVLQWREGRKLAGRERYLAQGVLVWMVVDCLFNSALLDSGEGHFYAVMTAVALAPRGRRMQTTGPDR